MMTDRFLNNLNDIFRRVQKVHDQLTSGHAIQRPSDAPPEATQALSLRSAIQLNDQYLRTIALSKVWLEANESSLTTMTEIVQRARDLAVQGANDTLNDQDRVAMAQEAEQLFQSALAAANTTHTGSYLFGGHKTTSPSLTPGTEPFQHNTATNEVEYFGDDGQMSREIGPGLTINLNVPGTVDGSTSTGYTHRLSSVLTALLTLKDNLSDPTKNTTSDAVAFSIGQIDGALDTVVQLRSEIGAKINRFDFASERLLDNQLQLTTLLSSVADVDTVEAATKFAQEQTVYQAALKSGASAIQPSLLDFLR
jgi:flagellar hook-associated protein 3 FlgL